MGMTSINDTIAHIGRGPLVSDFVVNEIVLNKSTEIGLHVLQNGTDFIAMILKIYFGLKFAAKILATSIILCKQVWLLISDYQEYH